MTAHPPTSRPAHRALRRLVVAAGCVVLICGCLLLALPTALRVAIPWALQRQAEVESSIEHVSADPWNGRLGLFGVRVVGASGLVLGLQRVIVRLDMPALLRGSPRVLRVDLSGAELDSDAIRRTRWAGQQGESAAVEPSHAGPAPLELPEADLHDVRLRKLSERLGRPVVIRRLHVTREAGAAPSTARVTLEAVLGDARIGLEGALDAAPEAPGFEGHLSIEGLDLDGIGALLGSDVSRLAGTVDADSSVTLGLDPGTGAVTARLDGSLGVSGADYAGPGAQSANGSARYQGRMDATWAATVPPAVALDGELIADALELAVGGAQQTVRVSLGQGRYAGRLETGHGAPLGLDGALSAATARITVPGDVAVDLTDLAAALRTRPRDGNPGALPRLGITEGTLERLRVSSAAGAFAPVEGEAVQLRGVEAGLGDGVAAASLELASLVIEGADGTVTRRASGLTVTDARLAADGSISAAVASVGGFQLGEGEAQIRFTGARVEDARREPSGSLRAAAARLQEVSVPLSGKPLTAGDLSAEDLGFDAKGVVRAGRLRVGAVAHERADGVRWKASGLSGATLSVDTEGNATLAQGTVDAADITVSGVTMALGKGTVSGFKVDPGGAVEAGRLGAATLDGSLAGAGEVTARDAVIESLQARNPRDMGVDVVRAASVEVRRDASTATVNALRLEGVRTSPEGADGSRHRVARIVIEGADAAGADARSRVSLGNAGATGLEVDGGGVTLTTLRAGRLEVGRKASPALSVDSLELQGVEQGDGGTVVRTIAVSDLVVSLERTASDGLVLPELPFAGGGGASAPPALRIGHLQTSGDSRLSFVDREPDPPFKVTLSPLALEATDLDTRAGGKAGTFKLDGRLGEYSRLAVEGRTVPGKSGPGLDLNGRLTGVDLELLTPYLSQLQGVKVRSGRADLKVSGELRGDQIEANTDLVISKLELVPDGKPAGEAGTGGMPLSTALMLLKDDNDTVKLKVPVSGSIDDPKFDFSDAIGQAVAKAATGAVMVAFQPVGLLLTAASAVGGLGGIGFEPVIFEAADVELPAEGITRLDALGAKLREKPSLKLAVCGRAVAADVAALAKAGKDSDAAALMALARARAERVRGYLAQQHQVSAAQLPGCEPAADGAGEGKPRVELALDAASLTAGTPAAGSAGKGGGR